MKRVDINISNRVFLIGIFFVFALGLGIGVFAAPNPNAPWHSWQQVDFSGVGACSNICTESSSVTDCSSCDSRFVNTGGDSISGKLFVGSTAIEDNEIYRDSGAVNKALLFGSRSTDNVYIGESDGSTTTTIYGNIIAPQNTHANCAWLGWVAFEDNIALTCSAGKIVSGIRFWQQPTRISYMLYCCDL
jgi:hypothetical protein